MYISAPALMLGSTIFLGGIVAVVLCVYCAYLEKKYPNDENDSDLSNEVVD